MIMMRNNAVIGLVFGMALGLSGCASTEKTAQQAMRAAEQAEQNAQQATMPATAQRQTSQGLIITPSPDSGVYIIFFEKDKKDNVLNAINHYQDEIVYDYKNLGGMMAIKILSDDVAERTKSYRQVDGVLQLTKSQTMHLH